MEANDLWLRSAASISTRSIRALRLPLSPTSTWRSQDKEFIVFVGPSGCGKSTTLRMIAGLEEISKGELYIGGTLINDVAPKDRDIAMVFQSYALYPHMTVYENMAFALKLRKVPQGRDRQAACARRPRFWTSTQYLDRKPKALSGGQRQRVAMGRAIVRDPRLSSCWTSPCPTWTPSCATRCAPRSSSCTSSIGYHLHLRHPRPDRGYDHGRPHRRHEGRLHPAGRHPAEACTIMPCQHVRGRLHRQRPR